MKSVMDPSTREEVISRIRSLDASAVPQWGKMNVFQMVRHCARCEECFLGRTTHKRSFLGRLIGGMALRNILKEDRPFQKNAPTSPVFLVRESDGDLEAEKQKWIELVKAYASDSRPSSVHWFFGTMSRQQLGQFAYKHTDHHLKQFGK